MKKITKNVFGVMIAAILAVGVLGGCDNQTAPSSSSGNETGRQTTEQAETQAASEDASDAATRDTLIIATEFETPSLTTAESNSTPGSVINKLTHNSLFYLDVNLMPQPDLVDWYEAVSDTEWHFRLKEGIKFHDGSDCTSEDVKATFEWVRQYPECIQYTKNTGDIEVIDALNFILRTEEPYSMLLTDLTHKGNAILPKELIESGNNFNQNPIGTGPYVFKDWMLGDRLVFEKFDDYFDKEHMPSIENIVVRIVPEGTSRTIGLENGEIDFLIEVPASDIERLIESDDIEVYQGAGTTHTVFILNNEVAPFDDYRVRKAINMAIDKEAVNVVANDGLASVALSMTPGGMLGSSDAQTDAYDPEGAKKYLEDWGGDPSQIELEILVSNEARKRAAEVIQASLGVIGINCTITQVDVATYLSVSAEGNYTGAIGNYTANNMISYIEALYTQDSIDAANRTRYRNPVIDQLVEDAKITIDPEERGKLLREATEILNADTPQVPLWQDNNFRAYNKDLKGVEITNSGGMFVERMYWQ